MASTNSARTRTHGENPLIPGTSEVAISPRLRHPVFSRNFRQSDWWQWRGSTLLLAKEYNKYLLAWARNRVLARAS